MPESTSQNTRRFEFAGFRLDLSRRRLTSPAGENVPLRARIFDLLTLFVIRQGELLEKRAIMNALWPNTHVDENNLNQAISELRRALGDDWHAPRFIVTVPLRGYQFVAPVRASDSSATDATSATRSPSEIKQPSAAHRAPAYRTGARTVTRITVASIPLIALVAVAALIAALRSPPATRVAALPERSVAVMPFVDISPDADQAYFADGFSEEIINHLALVDELRVIARSSSFALRTREADSRAIGATLGASHLLRGSVLREGSELRVAARLIDATSGTSVWSQTYLQPLDEVFTLHEEIARSVAGALMIRLGAGTSLRTAGETRNVDAYDAVLKARAWVNQEGAQALINAARLYREALTHDAEFAIAWAGLARVLSTYQYLVPDEAENVEEEMEYAVERALEIEPELWLAHAVQGDLLARRRDWAGAMASYERFRELAPAEANINTEFLIPFLLGDVGEAVAWARASIDIDPLSLRVSRDAQIALMRAGRFEDADAEYERSRDLPGDRISVEHYKLMRIWEDAGIDTIRAQMLLVADLGSAIAPTIYAVADSLDDRAMVLSILREAAEAPTNQDSLRLPTLAAWLSHFGDPELAVRLLHRTYLELGSTTYLLLWNPPLAPARSLPEFEQLVTELGMVDYWRSTGAWGDFCRPSTQGRLVECT